MTTIRALARISADREASQQIDQARYLIGKWAEFKHPDAPIEWYVDRSVSGSVPLAERPEGGRLLREIQPGDVLVVTKIDRLARNVADLLATMEHLEKIGASFAATEQDIDTSGPFGKFMLVLLGAIAELERGIIMERIRSGQQQMLRDGRHGRGKLPYGFTTAPNPNGRGLVVRPHPEQGPKLRDAIRNVTNGATLASQAARLGIKEVAFGKLLRNTRLYGLAPEKGARLDPEAALITMAEWQALQGSLNNEPRTWQRAPGYGRALECYKCGERMYLDTSAGSGGYRCETRPRHRGRPVISRAAVDEMVEKAFLERFGGAPVYEEVVVGGNEQAERIAALEVELAEVGKLIGTHGADVATLAARAQDLQDQINVALTEPVRERVEMHLTGQDFGDLWEAAEDAERAEVLAQVLRVVIHPAGRPGGRVEIVDLTPADAEAVAVVRNGRASLRVVDIRREALSPM